MYMVADQQYGRIRKMKSKNSSRFLIGALFGVMVGALIWYWQKSTSAEDGALALLDRLAAAEAKLRDMRAELAGRQLHASGAAEKVSFGQASTRNVRPQS
jgi:hypothetical protein